MTRRCGRAEPADGLKDEVYRQMLRLEAGRPAAQLALALALLHAWTALDEQPADSEPRRWLRRICPVCVRLIGAACQANDACYRSGD